MNDYLAPGSKIAWNGWASGWQRALNPSMAPAVLAGFAACIGSLGPFSTVQIFHLAGAFDFYLKINATLTTGMNLSDIGPAIETAWDGCVGYNYPSLTRQGVVVDYAAPGSALPSGSQTTPSTGGAGGGIINDLAAALGTDPTAIYISGAVIVAALFLSRR